MNLRMGTALFCAVISSSIAAGATEPVVQPIQLGQESVRFQQGVATIDLEKDRGAIQITPLPLDHGGLSFAVAVLNKSEVPANFDIDNFTVTAGSQALAVLSKDQLEKKAQNRAMWGQLALAALGGVSAGLAASQRDHYTSTLVTPRGTYRAHYSAPSVSGQFAAAASIASAGAGIAAIQSRLDETRIALGQNIIQLTTVDPQESYAGQIVITKLKSKNLPLRVDMIVRWNKEDYPFAFQVAKKGTRPPVFVPRAIASGNAAPSGAPSAVETATPAIQ